MGIPVRTLAAVLLLSGAVAAMSPGPTVYLADTSLGDLQARFGEDQWVRTEDFSRRVGNPVSLDSLLREIEGKGLSTGRILLVEGRWLEPETIEATPDALLADGVPIPYSGVSVLQMTGPFRPIHVVQYMVIFGIAGATLGLLHDGVEYLEDRETGMDKTALWGIPGLLVGAVLGAISRDVLTLLIQDVKQPGNPGAPSEQELP